jgi:hypothetical protein
MSEPIRILAIAGLAAVLLGAVSAPPIERHATLRPEEVAAVQRSVLVHMFTETLREGESTTVVLFVGLGCHDGRPVKPTDPTAALLSDLRDAGWNVRPASAAVQPESKRPYEDRESHEGEWLAVRVASQQMESVAEARWLTTRSSCRSALSRVVLAHAARQHVPQLIVCVVRTEVSDQKKFLELNAPGAAGSSQQGALFSPQGGHRGLRSAAATLVSRARASFHRPCPAWSIKSAARKSLAPCGRGSRAARLVVDFLAGRLRTRGSRKWCRFHRS